MPLSRSDMPTDKLLDNLEAIGQLKSELPLADQGYCSELGLHIQLRKKGGLERLQAGGRFRARIDLWHNSCDSPWEIKKYKPGEWEALVEPTLTLVKWLVDRGGLPEQLRTLFHAAVKSFSDTGQLILPMCVWSVGSTGRLGLLFAGMNPETEEDQRKVVSQLHEYVLQNPDNATAWDIMANIYSKLRNYEEALMAVNRALELAPNDGGINYTAMALYLGALEQDSPRSSAEDYQLITGPVGCSHADALDAVKFHAQAVLDGAGTSAPYQITAAANIVNAASSAAEQAERAARNLRRSIVWRD